MNDTDWRQSRMKRLQVSLIAGTVGPLIAILGKTLRWQVEGLEHLESAHASGHAPIIGFWHGRILAGTYFFRRRGIVVITSQNFDGEWIARIITRFGYGTARGSSSRNPRGALRQMIRDIRAGHAVGFTLDGPRGPAMQAKPGAVWLAMATGSPLVPFHVEAERRWSMKSWDRSQVPKPFSRVSLVVGAPIYVPPSLDEPGLESYRRELEMSLGRLRTRALANVGHQA